VAQADQSRALATPVSPKTVQSQREGGLMWCKPQAAQLPCCGLSNPVA